MDLGSRDCVDHGGVGSDDGLHPAHQDPVHHRRHRGEVMRRAERARCRARWLAAPRHDCGVDHHADSSTSMTSAGPLTGRGLVASAPSARTRSATRGTSPLDADVAQPAGQVELGDQLGDPLDDCRRRRCDRARSRPGRADRPGGGVPPHDVGEHDRRCLAVRHAEGAHRAGGAGRRPCRRRRRRAAAASSPPRPGSDRAPPCRRDRRSIAAGRRRASPASRRRRHRTAASPAASRAPRSCRPAPSSRSPPTAPPASPS